MQEDVTKNAVPPKGDEADTEKIAEQTENTDKIDASAAGQDDAAQDTVKTEADKIIELEAKLAEANDKFLRKAAEFENFRKRMNQEKANAIEFANQSLLLDIIPIIDDFERAILAGEAANDMASFLEGVKMIEQRLSATLESKWGLKRFNSAGEHFDPTMHEALQMEKSPDAKEALVQEEFLKGYFLKDRVIRAAKVKVLMPESGD